MQRPAPLFGLLAVLAFALTAHAHTDATKNSGVADVANVRGKPIVVQHYDCDGVPDHELGRAYTIKDGGQMSFRVTGHGMVYFTITSMFHDPDGQNRMPIEKTYHFVLGSYDSGEGASARVQGRFDEADKDAALVIVDRGWIWVSSTPPPCWGRGRAIESKANTSGDYNDPGNPIRPIADPAVSWSIYTVLRNQFSWAGATATEFIFRVENPTSSRRVANVLYNRDAYSSARHTYTEGSSKSHEQYAAGNHHRKAKGRESEQVKPTASHASDKEFVRYAENRVALIRAQPPRSAPECGPHHKAALERGTRDCP